MKVTPQIGEGNKALYQKGGEGGEGERGERERKE